LQREKENTYVWCIYTKTISLPTMKDIFYKEWEKEEWRLKRQHFICRCIRTLHWSDMHSLSFIITKDKWRDKYKIAPELNQFFLTFYKIYRSVSQSEIQHSDWLNRWLFRDEGKGVDCKMRMCAEVLSVFKTSTLNSYSYGQKVIWSGAKHWSTLLIIAFYRRGF
jgi:hypothetical protein